MPNQSGVWTLSQQFQARGQGLWPAPPGAPTIGTATAGSALCASVTFTAPASTGYPAGITSYTVTSTPGCITKTGASSPLVVTGLTSGTSYTFKVKATGTSGLTGICSAASNSITASNAGQQAYTSPGTYTWVAPSGVTSVSVVAVGGGAGGSYSTANSSCSIRFGGGGGGLGYINNYTVTPGNSYTVVVGSGGTGWYGSCYSGPPSSVQGKNSYFVSTGVVAGYGATNRCGAGYSGAGGGSGGQGSYSVTYAKGGGGGGAGGYSGSGGNGGQEAGSIWPTAGSGGGGGGGMAALTQMGSGGGGVGILGQGSNGAAGNNTCVYVPGRGGGGGSGGSSGGSSYFYSNCCGSGYVLGAGGSYGGGGYGSCGGATNGGGGAVRIIWPGNTRSFPSTNTGNL